MKRKKRKKLTLITSLVCIGFLGEVKRKAGMGRNGGGGTN